mmetsp:Transcript_17213/g.30946  ORF Transcript_17213/g.30946 Transcript_17213/m.30946 type:complete len:250 (+) Transcript_17213:3646-4395(+)
MRADTTFVESGWFLRLSHYFWPYLAKNRLRSTVFTRKCTFMIYRVLALMASFVLLGFSVRLQLEYSMVFYSQWSILVTVVTYSLLVLNYCTKRFWRYAHFSYELAWSTEFTDSVLYWCFIYPGHSTDLIYLLCRHVGVVVLLICDAFNNQIEFHRRHLFLVMVFMLTYLIFASIWTGVVGEIYGGLSFTNGISYALIVVGFVSTILSFVVGSSVYKFKRRYIAEKLEDHDFTALDDLSDSGDFSVRQSK